MINSNIPLMAKGVDGLKMLEDGSKLSQLWTTQRADAELSNLYNKTGGDLDKMLEIGKQSPMARFVLPQLQAQKQAQIDGMLNQQKSIAEIGKVNSESYKNNQQGSGYGLDNSEKQLNSAYQALTVAAKTGDPLAVKLALNNSLKAGTIDDSLYQQFNAQIEELGNNPENIKQYAQSLLFSRSKDPDKYMFTTADNVLNNKTSEDNNVRTTQASIYGTDKQFEASQARLNLDEAKLEVEKGKGVVQQFGDGMYMVYPNGNAIPIATPNGVVTKTNANLKTTVEEEKQRTLKVATTLNTVENLLDDATGSGIGRLVDAGARIFGVATDGDIATAKLGTLGGQLVALMPKMSGPQSDKDVEMYKQMAGKLDDPSIPIEVRKAALETIREINTKYSDMNDARGKGIPYVDVGKNETPIDVGGRPSLSSIFQSR